MTHYVVTANRLGDGEVLYLTGDGEWSVRLGDARVVADRESETMLAQVETRQEELRVIGPYLMKVRCADGRIEPLGQREIIRATGPTTHPCFGKQAEAQSRRV